MAEVTKDIFQALKNSGLPFQKFTVVTGSMEPLIPVGQQVVVAIGKDVQRFDVVAFWSGEKLICHVLWHINQVIADGGEKIYLTTPLSGAGTDLSFSQKDLLGPVLNYRLSWWQKLRLSFRLRRRGH